MAAGTKRARDDTSGTPKAKKSRVDNKQTKQKTDSEKPHQPPTTLLTEDVDFPRGGGTSFTALEVKAIRAEAAKEADQELFKVRFANTHMHPFLCRYRRRPARRPREESQAGKTRRRLRKMDGRKQFALNISTTRCVAHTTWLLLGLHSE